jgi:exoribonuclease R
MIPAETWNAQISMLTGFAAASLMVYARVGLLRTLPPPRPHDLQRLHRVARALHLDWPAEQLYPDFIRGLDSRKPAEAAMITACARLLRGSGYVAFDGETPADPVHAALASEYAHVTAPLRRLGDRYAGEICVSLCAGDEVPGWVLEKLHALPEELKDGGRRAAQYEGAVLNLVEAGILQHQVGQTFEGVVVDVEEDDRSRGTVTVQEPAVEARVTSTRPLPLGTDVSVRLTEADLRSRSVVFELV